MDGVEIQSLVKVWSIAIALICYCYFIASKLPKGAPRLIALFPVIFIFILLPLNLHTFHFCGATGLLLTWLANFKLLLFAFDLDPLSPPLPNVFQFIAILCLPIKIKKHPSHQSPKKSQNQSAEIQSLVFVLKVLLMNIIIRIYEYRPWLPINFVIVMYCINLYLGEEIILALCSLPARAILRAPLHRQFKEPYLSTSLQDFWSRRWNLMVPNILRPTVYNPTRNLTAPILGAQWAQRVAMILAFTVSGLMHELLYYYFTRVSPTWEVTWYFVLHGISTAAEVAAKAAAVKKVRLNPVVSWLMTMTFLMLTAKWLLFPQILRNGVVESAIDEYWTMVNFVKAELRGLF